MPTNLHLQSGLRPNVSPVSPGRSNQYRGALAKRQTRFDARSDRRYGNWSFLELPTAMLWLDSELLAAEVAEDQPSQVRDNLWP